MLVGVLRDQRFRHGDRLLLLPYLIDTLGVAVGRPCPSYWRAKAWDAWLAWEAPRGSVDAVSRVDGLRLLGGDVSIVAAQLGADDGCGSLASVVELPGVLGEPIRFVLNWGRRYSLWVFNFGLACCAIEFIATSMGRHDFIRLGVIPLAHGPRQADLLVVSGTVTDKMAPAIKRLYEQMPEPKYVISFGACSNCGGPYWDSYSVTKGVDQLIPVDVYVPGCPPRPEALLHGILRLQERIARENAGLGGVARPDPLVDRLLAVDGRRPVGALTAPPVRPGPGVVVPENVVWSRPARSPQAPPVGSAGRLPITELTVDRAGAGAPFGDDQVLPLPASELDYQHPSGEDRET